MAIDWALATDVSVKVTLLFVGGLVSRLLEQKPRLTSYFGHVGAFMHTLPDGNKLAVFTHSVVLRNTGRKTAKNVRLKHQKLPDFNIYPPVEYAVVPLPDGGTDVVIPLMVPGQELSVQYLYFPPLTVRDVNAGIQHEDGFAKAIPVLLQPQAPKWLVGVLLALSICGAISVVYLVVMMFRYFQA